MEHEGTNDFTEELGHELDSDYIMDDIHQKVKEETKMATLRSEAQAYVPQHTKNIADLKDVSVDLSLEDREGKDKEGIAFKYKVIVVDGEDYRVPGKVLGDLKSILDKKPTLKTFTVSKQGTGLNTQYTVIPME